MVAAAGKLIVDSCIGRTNILYSILDNHGQPVLIGFHMKHQGRQHLIQYFIFLQAKYPTQQAFLT